jgi:hypothetical protein
MYFILTVLDRLVVFLGAYGKFYITTTAEAQHIDSIGTQGSKYCNQARKLIEICRRRKPSISKNRVSLFGFSIHKT